MHLPVWASRAVVGAFGPAVLDASGALDRRKLATLVFSDDGRRRTLEAIVHPAVRAATEAWFAALAPGTPMAIADIPLLYETGRDRDFDKVIVVAAAPKRQVRRIMDRDSLNEQNRNISEHIPAPATFTASLRVTF